MVQSHDSPDLDMSLSPKEEEHSTPDENHKSKAKAITIRRTAPIRLRGNGVSGFPYRTSATSTTKRKRTRTAASTTLSKRKSDTTTSSNPQCSVRIGDVVGLAQPDGITQRFAKVSELCPFHNEQFAVVCVWLYTREEIAQDLIRHDNSLTNISSDETSWRHLNDRWSFKQDGYDGDEYMLSTKRTIALWDPNMIKPAPEAVAMNLCQNLIYNTSPSERRICDVNDPVWRWMKKILTLRPAGYMMPNVRS